MTLKDIAGSALSEGDQVLLGLGLGQMTVAKITRTESGLNPQNPVASVTVTLDLNVPAAPSGLVPGLVKIASAQPTLQ